jgi:hypothetical protein
LPPNSGEAEETLDADALARLGLELAEVADVEHCGRPVVDDGDGALGLVLRRT